MEKKKIAQYIEQEKLFSLKDKVLVTLSGGADSVALLRLLLDMGYTCEAAHCNFHLRGDESDRDEMFVRKLCLQLEIPLHIRHFQTTEEAAKRHISIEMAARELRYAWFEELRLQQGADVIAVAHHKDDSVETLLLNLIRGTGINGLLGIRPKNGKIVRPLLCLDRKEITEYLQGIGQTYVTDSTNLQDEYTRNKIRLNLLPLMQEINPSVKESLLRTAEHLNDAALLYNKGIEEGKQKVQTGQSIRIATLLEEPAPETLLFEILSPLGFNGTQIKDIFTSLSGQPGKIFLSKDWRVVKDRDLLLVTPANFSKAPTASFPDDPTLPLNNGRTGSYGQFRNSPRPDYCLLRCKQTKTASHRKALPARRQFYPLRHDRTEESERLPHQPEILPSPQRATMGTLQWQTYYMVDW